MPAAYHVRLVTGFSTEPRRHADIMAKVNADHPPADDRGTAVFTL